MRITNSCIISEKKTDLEIYLVIKAVCPYCKEMDKEEQLYIPAHSLYMNIKDYQCKNCGKVFSIEKL